MQQINTESLFMVDPNLVKKLNVKRKSIPSDIKSDFIKSITEFIKELKHKFSSFSYFHLRHILKLGQYQIEIENKLNIITKGYQKFFNKDHTKHLFNVIFDSLDSIGGGSINQIYKKYNLYITNYKNYIFKNTDQFYSRFYYHNENFIKKIAEDIVKGKISYDSFKNLTNPYIQKLKEYYRNNFTSKSKNLKSISLKILIIWSNFIIYRERFCCLPWLSSNKLSYPSFSVL